MEEPSGDVAPEETPGADDAAEQGGEPEVLSADEVKEIAKKLGWSEKGKFGGDPSKFIDAAAYIKRAPVKNQALNRQLKEMTNVVSELKIHNERVYKSEVARLTKEIDDLKAQRKVAIEDGDVDKVEKIEKQIDEIRESAPAPAPAVQANEEFDEWIEDNAWYKENEDMRKFADETGLVYKGKMPYGDILKRVRKFVEAEFPEKFKAKQKVLPGASVESSSRPAASKKAFTKADLSESQRGIMKQFVRAEVMTEAEYIADLVKQGELS